MNKQVHPLLPLSSGGEIGSFAISEKRGLSPFLLKIFFLMLALLAGAAEAVTVTFTASGNWTVPAGVTSITVEAWGGGGGGGAATGNPAKGGGGAGGQYARKVVAVTPGNIHAIVVGTGGTVGAAVAGGAGGDSTFAATVVVAKGGAGGALAAADDSCAAAGVGSATGGVGDPGSVFAGGSGSACAVITAPDGGAGGGGAGSTGAGGNAAGNTAGAGTDIGGGDGGAGLAARADGNPGDVAGGGGGAGYATNNTNRSGGLGGNGMVAISYAAAPIVTTSAATGITRADAHLVGTVDDNGAATTVTFEYGTTVAYGSTAVATQSPLAAGSGSTVVSKDAPDLSCNTTYHFRAKGENSSGVTYGSDVAFTTAPCVQVFVTANPTSCSNVASIGTQAWGTLTGPLTSDNVPATASVDDNQITNFLQCTGYNFAIPSGSTINGIIVDVERSASSTLVQDAAVRLVKGGVIQATDRSTAAYYPKTDAIEAHGAYTDLWGTTWDLADINAANFGAAVASTKAGTAGGARTVSVDHIPITVSYTPLVGMDHVVINAPASAVAPSQVSVTITPHTSAHVAILAAGTISLSTSTGTGSWAIISGTGTLTPGPANSGQATYAFGAAESSVVLGFTSLSAGTVALNVADAYGADLLLYTPVAEKANTIAFSGVAFALTNGPCTDGIAIGTLGSCTELAGATAGQALGNIYLTAVNANRIPAALHKTQNQIRSMQFGLSCHDPIAHAGLQASFSATAEVLPLCAGNGAAPTIWTTGVNVTFAPNNPSVGPFDLNYADVGKVVLWANRAATTERGSSSAFVVAPHHFDLSAIQQTALPNLANPGAANATGNNFVKAGEAFSITVTAKNALGVTTANFGQESSPEGVKLTSALAAGLGLTNNPALGGSFGTFTNGVATGTNFTWNEAGIITLTPGIADGNYLGAGDVTGTTSGNVGRFYAAQFALSGGVIANRTALSGCAAPAGCGTFSYMGEKMSAAFNLTAKAADGTTTLQNYHYSATPANNFAKLDPTAGGNPLALAAVDTGTPRTVATLDTATYGNANGNFTSGVATVTVPFAVTRGGTPSGPFDALNVGINPLDADSAALGVLALAVNVAGAPDTHGLVGSTKARYGRMKISNAHGSELLLLPIDVVTQYWNGTAYVTNMLDDHSTFAAADVTLGNYQKNLTAGETSVVTPPASVVFTDGVARYQLAAPGNNNNGSVDMSVGTLSALLPSNTARATFGVYKGNNEFIYMRENY